MMPHSIGLKRCDCVHGLDASAASSCDSHEEYEAKVAYLLKDRRPLHSCSGAGSSLAPRAWTPLRRPPAPR